MEVMVSICCLTYNHEKYIADAINGFLLQKTNFKYEILIHDDASTDRTSEIIKKYEKLYPGIIKPIYQIENQYSKGISIIHNFCFLRAQGKYIALCEGDDYWTDPLKLQTQVKYMEQNPECRLYTHAAAKVTKNNKVIGSIRPSASDKKYNTNDIIIGGGGMFATNSMLFPTRLVQDLPDYYHKASARDYPLSIYLSFNGYVYYSDMTMSVYRTMVEGSWSSRFLPRKTEYIRNTQIMLHQINKDTDYQYQSAINKRIRDLDFKVLMSKYDMRQIKLGKYISRYRQLSLRQKMKLYLGAYLPYILELLAKLRILQKES